MSLFEWSAPEHRAGDRHLSIIPNEIFLIILEHIAPTSTRLSSEQLLTSGLSSLSRVCRFFSNLCLPRIFQYSWFFSAPVGNNASHMGSRAWILCQHMAAKQPLARPPTQCVKVCRFTDFEHFNESLGSVPGHDSGTTQ
ncbi:hypothetical protein BDN67DRAFT_973634 [Paxillus ammoniavirescens]|nr:hypothetical protein BDN67DRAFT_973634 [Paxillus ammoniavirescens]